MTISQRDFAVQVAKEAGKILLKYFGTKLTKNIKRDPGDFATEADVAAESFIIQEITNNFPADALVCEESGKRGNQEAEYTWIIDPLDGTYNFSQGNENFGVMISRVRGQKLELTVIWNPLKEILAVGTAGQGASLNGKPVILSAADTQDKPLSVEKDSQELFNSVGYSLTNLGASANTLVTLAGERRGFISQNGFVWDFMPPALLLAEAGWQVTDTKGNEYVWDGKVEYGWPGIVAAPADLHPKLLEVLQSSN